MCFFYTQEGVWYANKDFKSEKHPDITKFEHGIQVIFGF